MKNISSKKLIPTHAQIIHSGEEYFSCLINLIDKAQQEILIHVYIFDLDETGNEILEHLRKAAARDVTVSVLVDAYGSGGIDKHAIEKLKAEKVFIRRFEPLVKGFKLQVGRRLHHKVIVIDEQFSLVGGINISNRYRGSTGEIAWLDYSFYLEGNICRQLASVCRKIEVKKFLPERKVKSEYIFEEEKNLVEILARVRQNDWVRGKNQIRNSYKQIIKTSKKNIVLATAYFMPGITLRRIIKSATKRGVEIKIVLSEKADVPFAKGATEYLYAWMLRNKIRLFEYKPSVVHAKVMAVDSEWMTIGSYNVNYLSDYSSIEMNIDIISKTLAGKFQNEMEEIIERDCHEITLSDYAQTSYLHRFSSWFSYQFVRINFSLLFFFQSKSKLNRIE